MPTYSAKCANCGNTQTYRRSIAERHQTPICCEKPMEKTIDAPGGFVDFPADGPKKVWGRPAWNKG